MGSSCSKSDKDNNNNNDSSYREILYYEELLNWTCDKKLDTYRKDKTISISDDLDHSVILVENDKF